MKYLLPNSAAFTLGISYGTRCIHKSWSRGMAWDELYPRGIYHDSLPWRIWSRNTYIYSPGITASRFSQVKTLYPRRFPSSLSLLSVDPLSSFSAGLDRLLNHELVLFSFGGSSAVGLLASTLGGSDFLNHELLRFNFGGSSAVVALGGLGSSLLSRLLWRSWDGTFHLFWSYGAD